MVLRADDCDVELHNSKERKRWRALAKLDYRVSKFPCPEALTQLGLAQCFNELCEVGQLTVLFDGENVSSYQVLTLEFLSTLEVVTDRTGIRAIRFRMRNDPYELTMEDFKGMHGFTADEHKEPHEFDRNAFWRAISGLNENFQANRAKSSMIRNPVLRMIQKACVGHPFARSQQGSVQRDELFLLWSLLHKRPINLAHYMIKHLERASKKDKGMLCCGGVIGSIALHLGVATDDLVRDIGETLMDLNYLKRTGFIAVDRRRRAYLRQREEDYYPLPDAPNTYVNGPTYTVNWDMNADSHRAAKAARPPVLPWQTYDPSPWYGEDNPHVELPEYMIGVEQAEDDDDDDDAEEVPRHDAGEASTSNPRRRDRQEREDEDLSSLTDRVARMEVRQEEYWAQNEARWEQYEASWNQFTDFNNAQWAQNDARWTQLNARLDEFRGYWQHPPPPPQ